MEYNCVVSRNNFALQYKDSGMRKLNDKKVKWIVKHMGDGGNSKTAATIQRVTQRRVQQLYRQYKSEGQLPKPKKCGNPESEPFRRKLRTEMILGWVQSYLGGEMKIKRSESNSGYHIYLTARQNIYIVFHNAF